MALIVGTGAHDLLTSLSGDDEIDGLGGTDTLRFAPVVGGTGATVDLRRQGERQDTRAAGSDLIAGIENLAGTQFADSFNGDARNNILTGFLGDDMLDGGAGNDVLAGASAMLLGAVVRVDDVLVTDNDTLIGGDGNDTVTYSSDGTLGESLVAAATVRIETLSGGPLPPLVPVTPGGPPVVPLDLSAIPGVTVSLLLQGAPQDTRLAGFDTLIGIENLAGSRYADLLTGDDANNILQGLAGNDTLEGGLGINRLEGGEGTDFASYKGAASAVTVHLDKAGASGGAGIDYFFSIEGLVGSAFDDTLAGDGGDNFLLGGTGNDRLFGKAGNDSFVGGAGDDLLNGGEGADTADYGAAAGPIRALLGIAGSVNTISAGRDILVSIENLIGGAFNDYLAGDAAANTIEGGTGNDVILGGDGFDTLKGGDGNDAITGGKGEDAIDPGTGFDTLRYGAAADSMLAAMDSITNFVARGAGWDRIGFDNDPGALFAGVTPTAIAFAHIVVGTPPAGGGATPNPGTPVSPPTGRITLPPGGTISVASIDTAGSLVVATTSSSIGSSDLTLSAGPTPLATILAQSALAASTATTLAVTQLDIFDAGGGTRSVLVVNDSDAGFDAATDMVIGFAGQLPGTLSAANFFLF